MYRLVSNERTAIEAHPPARKTKAASGRYIALPETNLSFDVDESPSTKGRVAIYCTAQYLYIIILLYGLLIKKSSTTT